MTKYRALILTLPSPEAAAALAGWLEAGNEIGEVWFTQLTNRGRLHRDRRLAWQAPRWSVTALAKRHGFKIREVPHLVGWGEMAEEVRRVGANVLISILFSNRVPTEILAMFDSPEHGNRAINLHPAPLPQYRGPHPYQSLILDGAIKNKACVTMHVMEPDFDTGAIIAARPVRFPKDGSMVRYGIEVARAAGKLLSEDLPRFLAGDLVALPQDPKLADYRRVSSTDFVLGPKINLKTASLFCQTFGGISVLDVSGVDEAKIVGVVKTLGKPTGQPPVKRQFSIDIDLVDARVRLKRKRPWTSPLRKLRTILIQMVAL